MPVGDPPERARVTSKDVRTTGAASIELSAFLDPVTMSPQDDAPRGTAAWSDDLCLPTSSIRREPLRAARQVALSTTLENEAIATAESEATQTD